MYYKRISPYDRTIIKGITTNIRHRTDVFNTSTRVHTHSGNTYVLMTATNSDMDFREKNTSYTYYTY